MVKGNYQIERGVAVVLVVKVYSEECGVVSIGMA